MKFNGEFGALKADGWKFHKLYARNYRCYSKTDDGSEYGQKLWVWQHLGGYLEVEDLFEKSVQLVQLIASGALDEQPVHPVLGEMPHELTFNTKENTLLKFDHHLHYHPRMEFYHQHSGDTPEDVQLLREFDNEWYATWKFFNLNHTMVSLIKGLLERGWISIEEDNRKK